MMFGRVSFGIVSLVLISTARADLNNPQTTDQTVKQFIAEHADIESLDLSNASITDGCLNDLAAAKNLQRLSLLLPQLKIKRESASAGASTAARQPATTAPSVPGKP